MTTTDYVHDMLILITASIVYGRFSERVNDRCYESDGHLWPWLSCILKRRLAFCGCSARFWLDESVLKR